MNATVGSEGSTVIVSKHEGHNKNTIGAGRRKVGGTSASPTVQR